jgi:hypothetical protein
MRSQSPPPTRWHKQRQVCEFWTAGKSTCPATATGMPAQGISRPGPVRAAIRWFCGKTRRTMRKSEETYAFPCSLPVAKRDGAGTRDGRNRGELIRVRGRGWLRREQGCARALLITQMKFHDSKRAISFEHSCESADRSDSSRCNLCLQELWLRNVASSPSREGPLGPFQERAD